MKIKSGFYGFNLIQMEKVGEDEGERCFVLGRHQTVNDAYVVYEWGTDFKVNAAHFLNEREAMAELQGRVDQARAKFNEKEGT